MTPNSTQRFKETPLEPAAKACVSASKALAFMMRRDGRHWSQDEGLGLVLLLSRLDPAAPSALFSRKPWTILALLRRSVRGPRAP